MATLTEKQLLQMKEKIDDAKSEISKLEGRKATIMDSLKEQFKCKSTKDAETLLSSLEEEIEKLETEIEEKSDELTAQYELEDE